MSFKALALGAPYCKAVCMGRALMIPGMVGKNAEKWLRDEDGGPAAQCIKIRLYQRRNIYEL